MKSFTSSCVAALTAFATLACPGQVPGPQARWNAHHHYRFIDFGVFGGAGRV